MGKRSNLLIKFKLPRSVLALWVVLGLGISACSPAEFFTPKKDNSIADKPNPHPVNSQCTQLDLGLELSAPSARKLLHCLNSFGALDPLEKLVQSLTDRELQPSVDLLNQYFLSQPKRMFELENLFTELNGRGVLDSALAQLGIGLEQSELISAFLNALGEAYQADAKHQGLVALKALSAGVSPPVVSDTLDISLQYTRADVFQALQRHFSSSISSAHRVPDLIQSILDYANLDSLNSTQHFSLDGNLFPEISAGYLGQSWTQYLGTTPLQLESAVPQAVALIHALVGGDASLGAELTSLYRVFGETIPCFAGGDDLEHPNSEIFGEISQLNSVPEFQKFVLETKPLEISLGNGVCSFPPEVLNHYKIAERLVNSELASTILSVAKSVDQVTAPASDRHLQHPVSVLLSKFLGGTGPNDEVGVKRLLPLFSELDHRDVWPDFLLFFSLPNADDAKKVNQAVGFLNKPLAELANQSILDVFEKNISQISAQTLYALALSLQKSIDNSGKLLEPGLDSLRQVHYANDAYPFTDFFKELLNNSPTQVEFYDVFFRKISKQDQFEPSLKLFSQMAKDGRLKQILGVVLTLFNRTSLSGEHPIASQAIPAFSLHTIHNLTEANLSPFPAQVPTENALSATQYSACNRLDFNFHLSQDSSPEFDTQIDNLVNCLDYDRAQPEIGEAIQILRRDQTTSGENFLHWAVDLINDLNLSSEQLRELGKKFISALSPASEEVSRALKGISLGVSGNAIKPLLAVFPVLEKESAELRHLGDLLASHLRGDSGFGEFLALLRKLFQSGIAPASGPPLDGFDRGSLEIWLKNKECEKLGSDPTTFLSQRYGEIIDDFNNERSNWELDSHTGRPPREWSEAELRTRLDPILTRLTDISQSKGGNTFLKGLLSFLKKEDPSVLANWLYKRATHYTHINYFYPNQDLPQVRLVNSLDRLELIVINADITVFGTNAALQAMQRIGEAWGDEPENQWPKEIRARFENLGKAPETLAEAVAGIYGWIEQDETYVGLPDMPGCHQSLGPNLVSEPLEASEPVAPGLIHAPPINIGIFDFPALKRELYNLEEVTGELSEEIPGSAGLNDPGLRVLRDLFWEIEKTTPENSNSPDKGDANNLSKVTDLGHLGVIKILGRELRNFTPGDPTLPQLLAAFRKAAQSPEVLNAFNLLLAQDSSHAVFWKLFEQVLAVEDEGHAKDPLEVARLKQIGVYGLTQSERLDLVDPLLHNLDLIIKNNQSYFSQNGDLLLGLLRSENLANFVTALSQDPDGPDLDLVKNTLIGVLSNPQNGSDIFTLAQAIDSDAQAHAGWDEFNQSYAALKQLPDFQALNLGEVGDDFFRFFSGSQADSAPLASELKLWLADRVSSKAGGAQPSDLEELLIWGQQKPEDVDRLLHIFAGDVQNGQLPEFLDSVGHPFVGPND